jgi:hypothetical protein
MKELETQTHLLELSQSKCSTAERANVAFREELSRLHKDIESTRLEHLRRVEAVQRETASVVAAALETQAHATEEDTRRVVEEAVADRVSLEMRMRELKDLTERYLD